MRTVEDKIIFAEKQLYNQNKAATKKAVIKTLLISISASILIIIPLVYSLSLTKPEISKTDFNHVKSSLKIAQEELSLSKEILAQRESQFVECKAQKESLRTNFKESEEDLSFTKKVNTSLEQKVDDLTKRYNKVSSSRSKKSLSDFDIVIATGKIQDNIFLLNGKPYKRGEMITKSSKLLIIDQKNKCLYINESKSKRNIKLCI